MDKQEAFSHMVRGLADQGWKKSVHPQTRYCVYRGPDGLKCAVGHLLDDATAEEADNRDIGTIVQLYRTGYLAETDLDDAELVSFLGETQRLHDGGDGGEEMARGFYAFSRRHGLDWPADVKTPLMSR